MQYLNDEFEKTIKPFFFSIHKDTYSALLNAGELYNDIFDEYVDKTYNEGSGYGWDALAALYINENIPIYEKDLEHDSEAGMFCLYSKNEKAIYEFLKNFSEYIKNESNFRYLMDNANFEEWD